MRNRPVMEHAHLIHEALLMILPILILEDPHTQIRRPRSSAARYSSWVAENREGRSFP
jgi:hypothetical protein